MTWPAGYWEGYLQAAEDCDDEASGKALREHAAERMREEPDLATLFFDLTVARAAIEGRFHSTVLAGGAYEDTTEDWYDRSVEVYGAADGYDARPLLDAGFSIVWVHHHAGGRALPDGSYCKCPARHRAHPHHGGPT